ncbi:MAG TPA: aminoacyl-tRNA hydrolase [Aggregatilineales bacterium]|nr:aminoacyl-tRNA hydrolase [Aggregatilineales bacterium]
MTDKFLIVGLGNPGREYQHNRHNIGFQVVDYLAARHGLSFTRMQEGAAVATGRIAGQSVVLAKPQKYMNRSGGPVGSLLRFYKIPLDRLLVIFDDLDLPPGTIRLRPFGGAGGQKGMRDIIERLGSEDFARLRIGIGRPPGRMDPAAYVLQDFGADELPIMRETIDRAADAVETWLREGIDIAMTRHNGPPVQA